MKKYLTIVGILLITTLLISCNNNKNNNTNKIQNEIYEDDGIVINYPIIVGLEDKNLESKVNSIIKDDAFSIEKVVESLEDKFNVEMSYDIKLNNRNYLSLMYKGIVYVEGSAYPNEIIYTTNIDLSTGDRIVLNDMIKVDDELVDKIINGEFNTDSVNEAIDYIKSMDKNEMINILNNADKLSDIGTEKQSSCYSYLTGDSIGICIEVPHVLDDYIEIEIDKS